MFCFHPASTISTQRSLVCCKISTQHPDYFHSASRRKKGLWYLTFWSMAWLHISHIAVNLQFYSLYQIIGRLMYRIYNGELHVLHGLFTTNSNIHVHDTRQKCHYHLPLWRTSLRKCGLRYVGASVWNDILNVNINPNVSEFIFLKQHYVITYFNRSHVQHVLLIYNYW